MLVLEAKCPGPVAALQQQGVELQEPPDAVIPETQEVQSDPSQCLSGAVLAACWRWRTGEALWEATEAALLSNVASSATYKGSLIIFDWDDTLFPTTALSVSGHLLAPVDAAIRQDLEACATAACRSLRSAKQHGRVIVVTNAISGWVQEMASRFMPMVEAELHDVTVVSARSIYEPQGLCDPATWKPLCFQRVVNILHSNAWVYTGGVRNLVSIGDSWYERAAAFQATHDLGIPCHVKSLKFLGMPSVEDVTRQLHVTAQHLDWFMSQESVLDLWLDPVGTVLPVTCEVLSGTVQTTGSLFALVQPTGTGTETGNHSVSAAAAAPAPIADEQVAQTSVAYNDNGVQQRDVRGGYETEYPPLPTVVSASSVAVEQGNCVLHGAALDPSHSVAVEEARC